MSGTLFPYGHLIGQIVANLIRYENEIEIKQRAQRQEYTIDDNKSKEIWLYSNYAYDVAKDFGLKVSQSKYFALSRHLNGAKNSIEIRAHIRDLRTTFIEELNSVSLLPASSDLVENFNRIQPFGERVAKIFPTCSEDIDEAHKCFGFGGYTACAFHIGRAMESAVKRLAKRMQAKATRDEWQSYINAMNDVVNQMP